MGTTKQKRLDSVMAALDARYGPGLLRKASELRRPLPAHVATGFAQLDALTGCGGVPLGWMSVLSGRSTSGKLTLAFKVLAAAQGQSKRQSVALVDLNHTSDPDYLQRAGVDLERLLIVRPNLDPQAVDLLVDLVHSRKLRVVIINGLADLQSELGVYRYLVRSLGRIHQALRRTNCALVWIDEPSPAWLRWFNLDRSGAVRGFAALHVEMQWEAWLEQAGQITGYRAQARLLKSRWARQRPVCADCD